MKKLIPIKLTLLFFLFIFQVTLFAGKGGDGKTVKVESTVQVGKKVTVTFELKNPFTGNLNDIKFNTDGWKTTNLAVNGNFVSVTLTSDINASDNGKYSEFGGVIEGIDVDNITGVKIDNGSSSSYAKFTPVKSNNNSDGQENSGNSSAQHSSGTTNLVEQDNDTKAPRSDFNLTSYNLNIADVKIFPNPFIKEFDVILVEEVVVKTVIIYNMTGKRILTKQPSVKANQIEVDMSGFKPGIYIVQINTDKGSVSARVIKGK